MAAWAAPPEPPVEAAAEKNGEAVTISPDADTDADTGDTVIAPETEAATETAGDSDHAEA